jgi:hypothetical protein
VEIPVACVSNAIPKQYFSTTLDDLVGKSVEFVLGPGEKNDFVRSTELFGERETEARTNAGNDCKGCQ